MFIPLILDDFRFVYKFFPIVFTKISNELRAVILLGENGCRYLQNGVCTIYDDRPPSCRIYPLTPYFDKIMIDDNCPSVGDVGEFLADETEISQKNRSERLVEFGDKYAKTVEFLDSIQNDLKSIDYYEIGRAHV